jgi:16S rRNA (adenine1518-N6/adenine1519-N6)-dimethyltransferase
MAEADLPPIREQMARHALVASKALGQNFLFDEQLLDRIAAVPGPLKGEAVYEVGPGPGGLTRALLRAGAQVTAVERDARALPLLHEVAALRPGQLQLVEGDALAIDAYAAVGSRPFHIVANLPYNVGTALLTRWLEPDSWPPPWLSLTLMFQLEVAERIVAQPGTSAYGRLAVLAQWRSHARLAMKVHRSAFTPPPKVMSAVVHITPATEPEGVNPRMLSRLTAEGFGQRRKMLRQSLKSVPSAIDALKILGIDETRRAETLTIAEWVSLARALGG